MREFLAMYEKQNCKKINPDMFNRSYDRPLVEYIVDICKNLEVLPAIKLESWEYITDQTQIRSEINKRLNKDPKIKNNKMLERLAQPNKSIYDLLVLHFHVKAKGKEAYVTRRVRIPKELPGGYYIRGGKKVLPLNQVVDNSTFVKGNVLKFKTALYPIDLYTVKIKLPMHDEKSEPCYVFRLNLFKKVMNPLMYYLAKYGVDGTIELFDLESVISVVNKPIDPKNYHYIVVNDGVYVEVHKKAFTAHDFVYKFAGSLYDAMTGDSKMNFKDSYSVEYWLERLSELISKKRTISKGERTLISFSKIMDPTTKKRLALRGFHKKNTFMIVRWMMTNYNELLKKDSNDLRNKRVRANECLAYYCDNYITRNLYSLLNTDNAPFDKYIRLLNSINEMTVVKATGGGTSSPTSMFRYERYNDFDAIDLSRYTLKGPTGLNGGKNKTSPQYRDIYPSHLGRYDLNVCSSSDPGLTGYLTANVQIDENGRFDSDNIEPDNYDPIIHIILDRYRERGYRKNRDAYIKVELARDELGFIQLRKRRTAEEMTLEFSRNPNKYGLYAVGSKLKLIPKHEHVDAKGFIQLIKRVPTKEDNVIRDKDGFIELQPIRMKLQTKFKSKG